VDSLSRFEKLKEDASSSQILSFDAQKITDQATSAHNYSIILLFSTDRKDINCPQCRPINEEFKTVVSYFFHLLGKEGLNSRIFSENPVFFAKCEITDCQDLFLKAGWKMFPLLVQLPPRSSKGEIKFSSLPFMHELMDDFSASQMAKFVESVTHFPIYISPPLLATYGWYLLVLVVGGLIIRVFPQVLSQLNQPNLWFALCLGVYGFTMAGTVFNAIHRPPLSYKNPQTGDQHFIYPSARQQFVFEGMIMAGLLCGCSLLYVGLTIRIKYIKESWKQRMYFFPIGIGFLVLQFLVLQIFKIKYPYYPF